MMSSVFKKLRVLTLSHIGMLLFVVLAVVGTVKFFGKSGQWRLVKIQVVGKDWSSVPSTVYSGFRPPYWLAESVKQDDVELSVGGTKIAQTVDVERYSRGGPDYDVYLTVRVNAIFNAKTKKYVYKGRAIEIGAPIDLRLTHTLVFGQVIDDNVPPQGYETAHVNVTVRYRNADPWIIDNVKPGDIMMGNPTGRVVAEVLSVTTEAPRGQLLFTDAEKLNRLSASGSLFIERDPKLHDLIVQTKLFVEKHDGEWFFGGHQEVKVGNFLWLYFPHVNLKSVEVESVENPGTNEKFK